MSERRKCSALLWHGPGHQSRTYCQNADESHLVHFATYGSDDNYMEWSGDEAFTGYFDEPKESHD